MHAWELPYGPTCASILAGKQQQGAWQAEQNWGGTAENPENPRPSVGLCVQGQLHVEHITQAQLGLELVALQAHLKAK